MTSRSNDFHDLISRCVRKNFPLVDLVIIDRSNFLILLFFDIPGPPPFDLAATNPKKLQILPHTHIYFINSHFLLEKGERGKKQF